MPSFDLQLNACPLLLPSLRSLVQTARVEGVRARALPRALTGGTVAASNGKVEACNMLLQHGADPSAFAEWGGTPMEWALERS